MFSIVVAAAVLAASSGNVHLQINEQTGEYTVVNGLRQQLLKGGATCALKKAEGEKVCSGSGLRVARATQDRGQDDWGAYKVTHLEWEAEDGAPLHAVTTSFFDYDDGEKVLFRQSYPEGAQNVSQSVLQGLGNTKKLHPWRLHEGRDVHTILAAFPSFSANASALRGYLQYRGEHSGSTFKVGNLNKPEAAQDLEGSLDQGPAMFFDGSGTVAVVSAASEFMMHSQAFEDGELRYGVLGSVENVPEGFVLDTVVTSPWTKRLKRGRRCPGRPDAFTAAAEHWGALLRSRYNKPREPSFSHLTTTHLQYSTDNGAYYYYNTMPGETYEVTMAKVQEYAANESLPYRHWLMDSWFYPRSSTGKAAKAWEARKDGNFPNGIKGMQERLDFWPLVAQNRFWGADVVYASQNGGDFDFLIEKKTGYRGGGISIPTEQRFWEYLFAMAKDEWGMMTYEQDWLFPIFGWMDATLLNATLMRDSLRQMGDAADTVNVTLQYCMAWPKHVLQSLESRSVVMVRASGDYKPGNDQWQPLGVVNMFVYAMGLVGTKDSYWSRPHSVRPSKYRDHNEVYNRLQSLVSTLSNGPVAVSDMVGNTDRDLVMMACMDDGRLLVADAPATPVAASLYHKAGMVTGPDGEFWTTTTDLGTVRYDYLFVAQSRPYTFRSPFFQAPHAPVYASWEANTTDSVSFTHPSSLSLPETDKSTFHFLTFVPVQGRYVFMGEAGSKWISVSRLRFPSIIVSNASVTAVVKGVPGEVVSVKHADLQENEVTVSSTLVTVPESGTCTFTLDATGAVCQ